MDLVQFYCDHRREVKGLLDYKSRAHGHSQEKLGVAIGGAGALLFRIRRENNK